MLLLEKTRKVFIHRLAHRLPPCEDITHLVSASLDRKLTLRERITLRLHLLICTWCRRYLQQLRFLRDVVHRHADHLEAGAPSDAPTLPPEARERIRRTLTE